MEPLRMSRSWLALGAVAVAGCAHTPPAELVNARTAYAQAEHSVASVETPAQLHTAHTALELAEQRYKQEGDDPQTRDLSYVAMRLAQRSEVEGSVIKNEKALAELVAHKERADAQELSTLRGQTRQQQQMLTSAEAERRDADARAARATADLARIAAVKQDARGTVITLSGEVLFASGKAELLGPAQAKLSEVATVLSQEAPDATIVVEGHTDHQGSQTFNLDLSTRRAQAVCDYLTTHGVARDRIRPQGLGFSRPVANNKTAEGRANNRRVEIVVQPASGASGTPEG